MSLVASHAHPRSSLVATHPIPQGRRSPPQGHGADGPRRALEPTGSRGFSLKAATRTKRIFPAPSPHGVLKEAPYLALIIPSRVPSGRFRQPVPGICKVLRDEPSENKSDICSKDPFFCLLAPESGVTFDERENLWSIHAATSKSGGQMTFLEIFI